MSYQIQSAVSLDGSSQAFTTGTSQRKKITTKRGQQGGADGQSKQQQSGGGGGGGGRKERIRINLKERKPVYLNSSVLGGEEEETGDGSNLTLTDGTEQRKRIVEVRTKHAREKQLDQRRAAHQIQTQASGFNTQGGNRRAMIVLPKNEEKMKAREMLMQIHPHISQVFRGLNPPDFFAQEPFNRILTAEAPCTPYRRRNMEVKTTVQWGERKLFLYELEFLTQYGVRPNTVVVYANVAPATRIPYLASLFPAIQFVLVDPTPLDFDETTLPNVQVRQLQFDDSIAKEIQALAVAEQKTLLFIANAVTDTPNGFIAGSEDEQYVTAPGEFSRASMDAQARWHQLLGSQKSLLKFSLPWTNGSTFYLDGDIYLPVWNPPTSTEARLVPNGHNRDWNHRHFEEQMFHFNTVSRVSLHEHGVEAEGLDGCFDCASEVYILERYLEKFPHMMQIAVGSQQAVTPHASQPATSLKLDNTKFKDPAWIAKQKQKKAQFLITLENDNDGQPLSEAQLQSASVQFDQQQQASGDADMEMGDSAAAASSSSGGLSASPSGDASMEDAAPSAGLTPQQQLKLAVGQMSQELSKRLTNNGTRTLATLNDKIIAKASFVRKNRR